MSPPLESEAFLIDAIVTSGEASFLDQGVPKMENLPTATISFQRVDPSFLVDVAGGVLRGNHKG
jgi:hypothetical protein